MRVHGTSYRTAVLIVTSSSTFTSTQLRLVFNIALCMRAREMGNSLSGYDFGKLTKLSQLIGIDISRFSRARL